MRQPFRRVMTLRHWVVGSRRFEDTFSWNAGNRIPCGAVSYRRRTDTSFTMLGQFSCTSGTKLSVGTAASKGTIRGARMSGVRSSGPVNCIRPRFVFLDAEYWSCFMQPFRRLEFWGVDSVCGPLIVVLCCHKWMTVGHVWKDNWKKGNEVLRKEFVPMH